MKPLYNANITMKIFIIEIKSGFSCECHVLGDKGKSLPMNQD